MLGRHIEASLAAMQLGGAIEWSIWSVFASFEVGTIARQARVALGDEVGEVLNARAVCVLIGERPGLSAPDSLGIYLTFGPRIGRTDAERNCISNIHENGLRPPEAAARIFRLLEGARALGLTGTALKDDAEHPLLPEVH